MAEDTYMHHLDVDELMLEKKMNILFLQLRARVWPMLYSYYCNCAIVTKSLFVALLRFLRASRRLCVVILFFLWKKNHLNV